MSTDDQAEFGDPREEEQSEVNIQFTTSANHQTVFVNGIYGGMSPRGDLHVDLVADYSDRPRSQNFEINEDGSLGSQTGEKGGEGIIRERQVSVFMQPHNAFSIATWMIATLLPANVEQKHVEEVLTENFDLEQTGGVE